MTISRAAIAALLALTLAGCISLFPKVPPAQLYRFGIAPAPAAQASSVAFNVQRMPLSFTDVASGDRILTVDGTQAAYIAGSRWAAPAATLFDEAEYRAFENAQGPARLLRPGDVVSAPVSLRLDVQTFEARYENGPKAAPVVVVSVRAVLVDTSERRVLSDQIFFSRQPAADNRVSAIVNAYDAAVSDVLGRIVDWAGHRGQA